MEVLTQSESGLRKNSPGLTDGSVCFSPSENRWFWSGGSAYSDLSPNIYGFRDAINSIFYSFTISCSFCSYV